MIDTDMRRREPVSIRVDELTRTFGDLVAVDHLNFEIPSGRMTGFVGANGAGKTTTMRMIVGVLEPTSGQVLWSGRPITAEDRRTIGYMPEERGLYPKQPVIDQLVYLARIKGASARMARTEAMECLERFGLADRAREQVQKLSLGNQQRVQVTASLLADPTALILDEPFSGLDPVAVDAMADVLREKTAQGVAVLFSSHQLDLVDRLCDRMIIMHEGRMVANGTIEELREAGPRRHRVEARDDLGWLRSLPGLTVVDVDGTTALVEFPDPTQVDRLLDVIVTESMNRGGLVELTHLRPSLGEIYREVAQS
ncbi:ABC transporter ATP-binding protein [Cutibacterium avidum]|uniref:ABC transporter ATP-binding protein n=1 Tax=Cutibacterium avidum TaxID=33010 RepID=UPI0008F57BA0|nr:ATP-binding cassette domain-containing protein [Cutibacterium avidum]MDK7698776.1 ATP-binding cassette domain-containing protein [Cutibacterium avidum]OIJ78221.1 ABC transporter ATP-binding protein [Cutibacterium avidum]